jgi:ABC-type branched-subunit amino acid transport system substrate-binding protein
MVVCVSMACIAGLCACGSVSSSSSTAAGSTASGSSSPSAGSTAHLTGSPIKILVDSTNGNALFNYPGTWGAAQAASRAINERGGINGHPLSIITCNNQGTPNGAAACAQQAVADKVVAYTGFDSPNAYNVFPVLKTAKIPSVLYVTQPSDLQTALNYPINGGAVAQLYGVPFAAAKAGAKTAAIVQNTFPGYQAFVAAGRAAAKAAGLKVLDTLLLPTTTTDFAATVQKLRSLNPDAVLLYAAAPPALGIMQTGEQIGFSPIYVGFAGIFGQPEVLKTAPLTKSFWNTSSLPPTSASDTFSGVATYNEEMNQAGSNGVPNTATSERDETSLATWLAVHGLAKVMATIQGPVTAASLTAALRRTTDMNLYGLVTWSPGSPGLKTYPKLTNGGAVYIGPAKNGVYTPLPTPVPAIALSGVK